VTFVVAHQRLQHRRAFGVRDDQGIARIAVAEGEHVSGDHEKTCIWAEQDCRHFVP
jgi:hypothetical protein